MKHLFSTVLRGNKSLIVLFVLGFMFTMSSAAFSQGLYDLPTGNFVDQQVAIDRINDYMDNTLKVRYQDTYADENLQDDPQREDILNSIMLEKTFYFRMLENLENGNGAAVSIVHGLRMFEQDRFGEVAESEKFRLRNHAINLLR